MIRPTCIGYVGVVIVGRLRSMMVDLVGASTTVTSQRGYLHTVPRVPFQTLHSEGPCRGCRESGIQSKWEIQGQTQYPFVVLSLR